MPNQDGRDSELAYPYGNYFFALEITADGSSSEVGQFLECSGLKTSAAVFEIEEGGLNGRTHKRVGQSKWENIVLRYATSSSTFLVDWRNKWLLSDYKGLRTKFSGAITLKNNQGTTIRTYEFKNAWPVSWEGPSLNSGGSELAIETLEIAHDGLKIK